MRPLLCEINLLTAIILKAILGSIRYYSTRSSWVFREAIAIGFDRGGDGSGVAFLLGNQKKILRDLGVSRVLHEQNIPCGDLEDWKN